MQAEIIALGDELTSGQRLDTNSQWLSQQLAACGVRVSFHTTAGDDLTAGCEVFRRAIERSDVIISTGGLGPTADDLTRQCIAMACGVDLVRDAQMLAHIRRLFARRGRQMPERNAVQATFPRGSHPIPNPHGTAPGIDMIAPRVGHAGVRIFALPGVPAEMREMWDASVRPALVATSGPACHLIRHRAIHCYGAGESAIEAMLPGLIQRGHVPTVGITASQATITLRITAEAADLETCCAAMQPTADLIYRCLGNLVFGEDEDTLQDVVIRLLAQRGQTLATVENGSGGTLAQWLSAADPDGRVYRGGWVLRDPVLNANSVADQALARGDDVPDSRPAGRTAVHIDERPATESPSPAARRVRALASGCRASFQTDYTLTIGPFPADVETDSGPLPVHMALAGPDAVWDWSTPYVGHPEILLPRTVKEALNFLRLTLVSSPRPGL